MGFLRKLFKSRVRPIDIGVPPNIVVSAEESHAAPSASSQPHASNPDILGLPGLLPQPCPHCGAQPKLVPTGGHATFQIHHQPNCPQALD